MQLDAWAHSLSDIAEVRVMGQINHLAYFSHLGEQPERLFRAKVIKGFHDIVGDERHWPA